MPSESREQRIHDLDATLRVGKHGVESVADELGNQLVQVRGHTAVFER